MIPANTNKYPAMTRLCALYKLKLKWDWEYVPCPTCKGTGIIHRPSQEGFPAQEATCHSCGGACWIGDKNTLRYAMGRVLGDKKHPRGIEFTNWHTDLNELEAECYENEPAIILELLTP